MKFQDAIKMVRVELGLTQKELANKFGTTLRTIGRWENGFSFPKIQVAKRIQKVVDQMDVSERCKEVVHSSLDTARRIGIPADEYGFPEIDLNLLSETVDGTDTAVYIIESDTYKILYANPATEKLAITDRREIENHTCYEYVMGETAPCKDCPLQHLKGYESREEILKAMKTEDILRIRSRRTKWNGKEVYIVYVFDVTSIISEKRASEAKTDFLSRVSHDIRTPLNSIVNLTNILEEEIEDPKALKEDILKMKTANRFLLSLVNDILDMTRIEQKSFSLSASRYGYQEFLDYMENTFQPLAHEKNITFQIIEGERNVDILIDKLRFNQLCFNMISNAIKYTPEGGHVTLKMLHDKIQNGKLPCDIYVIDDGIGMSQEFQKKMFEPFEQEGRMFKAVEGTGLGLSIVKEIVDLLHGTIDVDSEEGKGTTFHVHIDMDVMEGVTGYIPKDGLNLDILWGKRVLLAEDHPLNQEIAKRLLEKVGVTVDVVSNGIAAVDRMVSKQENYDCILMDIRMPGMDGIEATKQIRKVEENGESANRIPIIAMTANAFTDDSKEAMKIGMDAYLTKPIEKKKLYETLIQFL